MSKFKHALVILSSFLLLSVSVGGCMPLEQIIGTILISILGVQPSADFQNTGHIQVSLLPENADTGTVSLAQSLKDAGLKAQIENKDGTYSDCEFVDEKNETASPYNVLAVLIDDSGSMGNAYPDACPTCPHDPENKRVDAVQTLSSIIYRKAPASQIAVMDFGPDPDTGFKAIRLLSDYTTDLKAIEEGLTQVDGTQEVGTPLWDALAETLESLDEEGKTYEEEVNAGKYEGLKDPMATESTREVKRYLLVLSDGDDRDSVEYDMDQVIALAKDKGIGIYVVGLGLASAKMDSYEIIPEEQLNAVRNLQKLAEETGGFYASAENPNELESLYHKIAQGMTEGYKEATFACKEQDSSTGEAKIPEPESRVKGRMLYNGMSIPFTFLAP